MSKILGSLWAVGNSGKVLRALSVQLCVAVVVVLSFSTGVTSCVDAESGKVGDYVCLACHDGRTAYDASGFAESVHGQVGLQCEDCHGPGAAHVRNGGRLGLYIENPKDLGFQESYAVCFECHISTTWQYETSMHFTTESANCFDCHNVHNDPPHQRDFKDNSMCLVCHVAFEDDALIDTHIGPFHNYDPAGTGSGRCSSCHMVPIGLRFQDIGLHDHGMRPVSPAETLAVIEAGETPQAPNTCAGILGCHDPNVPGSGSPREIDNVVLLELLENAFDAVGGIDY